MGIMLRVHAVIRLRGIKGYVLVHGLREETSCWLSHVVVVGNWLQHDKIAFGNVQDPHTVVIA